MTLQDTATVIEAFQVVPLRTPKPGSDWFLFGIFGVDSVAHSELATGLAIVPPSCGNALCSNLRPQTYA